MNEYYEPGRFAARHEIIEGIVELVRTCNDDDGRRYILPDTMAGCRAFYDADGKLLAVSLCIDGTTKVGDPCREPSQSAVSACFKVPISKTRESVFWDSMIKLVNDILRYPEMSGMKDPQAA